MGETEDWEAAQGSQGGWWEGGCGERTRLKAGQESSQGHSETSRRGDGAGTTAALRYELEMPFLLLLPSTKAADLNAGVQDPHSTV